jgi:hypothetical protein
MASSSTNKQPAMIDRPFLNSTLVTVASGQLFSTSLIPTAVGNATNVLDVDSSLTDTSISGAYIDEIWLRYSKERNIFLDATTAGAGTYSQSGTTAVVVTLANHNLKVGQSVYLDYTSGTAVDETATVTAITSSTFTVTSAGTLTTSGNVNVYQPIDICFYVVGTSSITNTNQFFPLFTVSVPAIAANQTYSLTLNEILPLINHPVPHAGDNFGSANNEVSPKTRGLVMERGQALYAAVSGTTALTSGFYVCVQGGFY